MKGILFSLFLLAIGSPAWANSCPSYTYTLTNGTTADASQVMANFNTIMNCASFYIGTTSTGSATAQALATVSPGVFALTSGNRITFIAGFTSTGATTLNVASTGATNVLKKTAAGLVALATNDMISGQVYTVQYDGTQYELLDPVVTVPASASTGGFVNKLRNASQTAWFHGTSVTVTTSGGWGSEGVYVVPTGASVTVTRQASSLTAPLTFYSTKITGATSATDVITRFPIESFDAAPLAGATVTCQIPVLNNTGASLNPTFTVKHAGSQDVWTTPTTDVSAAALQTVANGATATLAYTFAASAASNNGLSIDIDFGNNFSSGSNSVQIGGGFDCRATPGVATGLNNSPPAPEIRDAADDLNWNMRFYETSYDNGTAPGTSGTRASLYNASPYFAGAYLLPTVTFKIAKRAAPTMSYWDSAGNANKATGYDSGYIDNLGGTFTALSASTTTAAFTLTSLAGADQAFVHFAADATVPGA